MKSSGLKGHGRRLLGFPLRTAGRAVPRSPQASGGAELRVENCGPGRVKSPAQRGPEALRVLFPGPFLGPDDLTRFRREHFSDRRA